MSNPASITPLDWQTLTPADDVAVLHLQQQARLLDGQSYTMTLDEVRQALSQAVSAGGVWAGEGHLACAAWVTLQTALAHEVRAYLYYWVAPDQRSNGVEQACLEWLEAQATHALYSLNDPRPTRLRLDFYDKHPDSILLYPQYGFKRQFVELEMVYWLTQQLPPQFHTWQAEGQPEHWPQWSAERAPDFFEVYQAAFSTRPGFPNWPMATWVQNLTGHESFRPDVSLLIPQQAFIVCHSQAQVGHIAQVGVHPAYRRRHLARQLLAHCLLAFQAQGLTSATLEVNLDNIEAHNLYTQLGFQATRAYHSYQKAVE